MHPIAALEPVRQKLRKLLALLEDPQPGLMTWNAAVDKARMEILKEIYYPPVCIGVDLGSPEGDTSVEMIQIDGRLYPMHKPKSLNHKEEE